MSENELRVVLRDRSPQTFYTSDLPRDSEVGHERSYAAWCASPEGHLVVGWLRSKPIYHARPWVTFIAGMEFDPVATFAAGSWLKVEGGMHVVFT